RRLLGPRGDRRRHALVPGRVHARSRWPRHMPARSMIGRCRRGDAHARGAEPLASRRGVNQSGLNARRQPVLYRVRLADEVGGDLKRVAGGRFGRVAQLGGQSNPPDAGKTGDGPDMVAGEGHRPSDVARDVPVEIRFVLAEERVAAAEPNEGVESAAVLVGADDTKKAGTLEPLVFGELRHRTVVGVVLRAYKMGRGCDSGPAGSFITGVPVGFLYISYAGPTFGTKMGGNIQPRDLVAQEPGLPPGRDWYGPETGRNELTVRGHSPA